METTDLKNDLPEEESKKPINQAGAESKKEEKEDNQEATDPGKNSKLDPGSEDKPSEPVKPEVPASKGKKAEPEDQAEKPKESEAEDSPKKEEKESRPDPQDKIETKDQADADKEPEEASEEPSDSPEPDPIKPVDYSKFSIDELVNTLSILVADRPVAEIRDDVDIIKINFYKKLKVKADQEKAEFLKEGGKIEDYKPLIDPREEQLKSQLNLYRRKKLEHNKELELQKQANLEEKYSIIESIKGLINKEESINKTFQEFRDLQNRWHSLGLVPQSKLKDLWENYHYHVEKFYDYIKINKELRDLDLKKNMEAKLALCEKTEELILSENVVNSFKTLQRYHEQWREIGPVPRELKDELWERFRTATSKINKRHQQHFETLKSSLRQNLEEKTKLCEKVEEILTSELKSHKDWENKSREIIETQKVWKTIGFAPKKHNTLIYERFRKACDTFFENKRAFYAENKEIQQNNLQLKTDLCIQAEALQESTEWKKTTEDLIKLQKKWKEIGPVPKKASDQVWKRFRAACDTFFNRKSDFYANIDQTYEDNLGRKQKLIEEIESFKLGDKMEENFSKLQDFQRLWAEIGYVPIKEKDAITQKYRTAINKLFDQLEVDDTKKEQLKYKTKLEELSSDTRSKSKLLAEREKYLNRIKKLESDIVVWENNIGFFAKSENAEPMIKEFTNKIDRAKQNLKTFQEKIKMIDNLNIV